MSSNTPYISLFYVTLTQQTEFNTAGNDTDDIDITLAKNGKNEYTIRGTSLAGAIVHQAKKLGYNIPSNLSGQSIKQIDGKAKRIAEPSCMKVFNAILDNANQITQFKQHVAIDDKTGAAIDNALFDIEVLPRGNTWQVLIEVAEQPCEDISPSQIIANVLNSWQHSPLFLGHRPTAGYGWFNATNVDVVALTGDHVFDYPNNSKDYARDKNALLNDLNLTAQSLENFIRKDKKVPSKTAQIVFDITLRAGINTDESGEQWGLDGFFIGGHEIESPNEFRDIHDHVKSHLSSGSSYEYTEEDTPDSFFVLDHQNNPYIPSASIRGPLRAALIQNGQQALAEQLFGNTTTSSNCYIKQAYLVGNDWQGMIFHNHAEDEFTAGVFESAKFVRASVTEGTFKTQLIIEYLIDENEQMPIEVEEQLSALKTVFEQAENQQLPIGAKKWVDSGWLKWTITQVQGENND